MAAGYSTNPLYKKLGMKEGIRVLALNAPEHYRALLEDMANKLTYCKPSATEIDVVHLFTNSAKELNKTLPKLKEQIKKDGTIWVSWYKKSAGKPTELTENMIRDTALATGLVDVKVCAVDEEWSGLKLVYRLKDR